MVGDATASDYATRRLVLYSTGDWPPSKSNVVTTRLQDVIDLSVANSARMVDNGFTMETDYIQII